MANKKMCPYGSVSRGNGCSFIGRKHLLTKDEILKYCPKNTNSRCEIIPPKPKFKTIKGWVDRFDYECWIRDKQDVCYLYHGKIDRLKCIPCEIRVNTKYLKEKK